MWYVIYAEYISGWHHDLTVLADTWLAYMKPNESLWMLPIANPWSLCHGVA